MGWLIKKPFLFYFFIYSKFWFRFHAEVIKRLLFSLYKNASVNGCLSCGPYRKIGTPILKTNSLNKAHGTSAVRLALKWGVLFYQLLSVCTYGVEQQRRLSEIRHPNYHHIRLTCALLLLRNFHLLQILYQCGRHSIRQLPHCSHLQSSNNLGCNAKGIYSRLYN